MRDGLRRIMLVLAMALLIITMAPLSFADGGDDHDVEWWNFRNTADNNAVTNRPTPTNDQEAWGKWQVKVGTNYTSTAPTPPIIVDNKLYVAVGKYVQELNKETGEVLRTSEPMPAGAGYAMQSPVYADGKIFVAIAQGRICAVNIDDLSIAWVTDNTNILKGQTVSPISYVKIGDKGYVHTGTWVANGGAGDLICATTDDEDVEIDAKGNKIKNLVWSFNPNVVDKENLEANNSVALGYYWTGAYVTEKYLAIGSDNGSTMGDYVNDTAFYTLNPLTGEIIDAVYGIKGQVRSTAVYYNGCLYFTTKGAKVYKIPVDENGNLGEPSFIDLGEYDAVATTATVVVHNGKIYLGLQGKGGQFNSDGGHGFMVMRDDKVLSQSSFMYTIPVPGYPQAGALLSTYHEDEDFNGDGAADGRVYLFFTYNAPPGGVFYTYDAPDQTEPTALTVDEAKIFIPGSGKQQFCISSIVVDREGNLYYKNDSAHLFCVESNPAILSGIELFDDEDTSIPLDQVFMPKIGEYSATLRPDAAGARVVLQLEDGVTATVAGQEYIEGGVVLPMEEDELSIEITTNKNGKGRTYSLVIHKAGVNADLASLGSAINNSVPSTTNKNTRLITPAFDKDVLDYTFDWITTGTGKTSGTIDPATKTQMNIFLKLASENSTVKVWPGENIKEGNGGSSTLNLDGSIKASPITNATYSLRFPLYSNDVTRDSTATIVVTAEDGVTEKTYNITFSRRVYVAEVLLKEKETMAEGETVKLEASINPPNATDRTLAWESSDESVATVDEEGNVTSVGVGTTTIIATSSDGPSGETLVEVRHNWDEPTYVWSDDNSSVTATRVCSNNAEHIETETVESTSEITKPATETEDGVRTYTATFANTAFETQTKTETIPKLDHTHEWGTPTYTWAEDNRSVTATRVCAKNAEHVETETVNTTSEVTTQATCETKGKTTYTAVFTNTAFSTQTKTLEDINALSHDWNAPTYTWADDNRSVTATRVCKRNETHIETETVNTNEVITPATETADGLRTFTAAFISPAFETQTKTETIPMIGHTHNWGTPTYTWSEDNSTVTATRKCASDEKHVETETVNTTSEVTTQATCETKGKTTYTAVFTNTAFTTQTKTLEDINALSHDWNVPTYTWADDNRSVTATRVCKRNETHIETETVNTTSEVTTQATCETKGETTYTAAFVNTAFAKQTKTIENIAALNHNLKKTEAKSATCTEAGNRAYWTCNACKKVFSDANGKTETTVAKMTIKASHKLTKIAAKVATCTTDGNKEYWICSVCNKVFSDSNGKTATTVAKMTIKASHKLTKTAAKAATCTTDGNKEYWTCSACKKVFSDSVGKTATTVAKMKIAKLNHKFGPWTKLNATQHQRVCAHDKSHVEKANHIWDAGKVTKQPTTAATGVKTFTCTVCKATKTETIAKLPVKDSALRRIHGTSRFKTSFAIAETYMKETKQTKLNSIIVASSTTFPDALAGSYLAKAKNAPIIIWHEQLNKDVQTFIKQKVKPGGTVYILGGTIAVGESIKQNMGGYKFVRLADTGRYGTNLKILDAVGMNKAEVLVCDGGNDGKGINALIASATGRPLLLVDKNGLIPIQKTWLGKNKGKIIKLVIVGDGKSVSAKVESELKAYGAVTRISGKNGDEVSANVASTYYKNAKEIFMATMDDYPDGLCGGPLAIFSKGPILLVNAKNNAASVKYAKTLTDLTRANILGGDKALPETLARKIAKNTKAKVTELKK